MKKQLWWRLTACGRLAIGLCCLLSQAQPVTLTAQEDHQRLMDLLHITELRRGADGSAAPSADITLIRALRHETAWRANTGDRHRQPHSIVLKV